MKFYLFIELFSLALLLLYKTINYIIHFIFLFFLFIVCRYVWPWAKGNSIAHDSYSCARFSYTKAFPTKRKMEPNNFVASVVAENHVLNQSCPKICRPREHLDWEYCWQNKTKCNWKPAIYNYTEYKYIRAIYRKLLFKILYLVIYSNSYLRSYYPAILY